MAPDLDEEDPISLCSIPPYSYVAKGRRTRPAGSPELAKMLRHGQKNPRRKPRACSSPSAPSSVPSALPFGWKLTWYLVSLPALICTPCRAREITLRSTTTTVLRTGLMRTRGAARSWPMELPQSSSPTLPCSSKSARPPSPCLSSSLAAGLYSHRDHTILLKVYPTPYHATQLQGGFHPQHVQTRYSFQGSSLLH